LRERYPHQRGKLLTIHLEMQGARPVILRRVKTGDSELSKVFSAGDMTTRKASTPP